MGRPGDGGRLHPAAGEGTAEAAGMPVYNFCVAVDDALMDVTVIRAEGT